MEGQQIPINEFNGMLFQSFKVLGFVLISAIILRYIFKVRSDLFDKALIFLKFLGYTGLALGAYFLTYQDGKLVPGMPESLSLSQCFVIILAVFEAISNLVALFKIEVEVERQEYY
ncbi:hypothetical protein [Paenibacillus brasilensis]|uniref:DUF2975 domain-containing protein n=1 Tax=Paenibacillus brasilensis TaxID=128574 RepID=A0ABU0L585_9BACL|nr:hypothetical protein [Paenibacillus brasilensis]MDQ0496411.1 hypothetical protein [Paenibacillus brasilensis]